MGMAIIRPNVSFVKCLREPKRRSSRPSVLPALLCPKVHGIIKASGMWAAEKIFTMLIPVNGAVPQAREKI